MSLEEQLINAVRRGDKNEVKSLLDGGTNPNIERYHNETPLHYAVERGDTEIVELLLNHKANINAERNIHYGRTPLLLAACKSNIPMVTLLLKRGATPNSREKDGETSLHHAAKNGCIEIVKLLLDYNAEINTIDSSWRHTPLDWAVTCGFVDIARLLLSKGAVKDFSGRFTTSIFATILRRNAEMLKFLLEEVGVDVNTAGAGNYRIIHNVFQSGNIEMLIMCLRHGVNMNVKSDDDFTPISYLFSRYAYNCKLTKEMFFYSLIFAYDINQESQHTIEEINNKSDLQNCLTAFKQIKAMPHLGKLIEANTKKEGAKTIASYINNEAEGQELIKELRAIEERYSSNRELSFIPEHMLDFVEHITIKFLKFHTDNKKAIKLLLEQKDDIKITKAVLVDSKITDKTRDEYERLPNEIIQEISSYSNLNELNFDNALLALNEKADVFLSELKNVYQSPSTALAASQPEVVSGQSKNVT